MNTWDGLIGCDVEVKSMEGCDCFKIFFYFSFYMFGTIPSRSFVLKMVGALKQERLEY